MGQKQSGGERFKGGRGRGKIGYLGINVYIHFFSLFYQLKTVSTRLQLYNNYH